MSGSAVQPASATFETIVSPDAFETIGGDRDRLVKEHVLDLSEALDAVARLVAPLVRALEAFARREWWPGQSDPRGNAQCLVLRRSPFA